MNVELGELADGGLAIRSDQPFPRNVHRIEYYRDQRLILLVYGESGQEDELMQHELCDMAARIVETHKSVMIIDRRIGQELHGYNVSLVHA